MLSRLPRQSRFVLSGPNLRALDDVDQAVILFVAQDLIPLRELLACEEYRTLARRTGLFPIS